MSYNYFTIYHESNRHLTFENRQALEKLVIRNAKLPKKDRLSKSEMAKIMNIGRTILYRELKRGECRQLDAQLREYTSYSAQIAQENYDQNQTAKGPNIKLNQEPKLEKEIESLILKHHYSPYAASVKLKKKVHEFKVIASWRTIYHYIERGFLLHLSKIDLPRRGQKAKKPYQKIGKQPVRLGAHSITERPKEVETREVFGHWEMDCIVSGRGHRPALLTLNERKTRKTYLFKMPDQTQTSVLSVMDSLEKKFGITAFQKIFKSITVDHGSEFMDFIGLQQSHSNSEVQRTLIYYCHPYAPQERGTNECINCHIRRFISKGSNIGDYSDDYIQWVEDWLNNYPRKILNGLSANEALENLNAWG